ncbi:MAG TPA: nuclear transport factor 2 family protein [Cyclobacteriaceae bacterium]
MNSRVAFIILFFLSIIYCSCNAQPKNASLNLAIATKAISEANRHYFQAFVKGDSALFINSYAEDCWIMTSTLTLCGVNAAQDFYTAAYHNKGVRNGKLITNELYGNGDQFITEEGFYQFLDKDNQVLENGTFLAVWEKTKAGWILLRSSFHNLN